MQIRCNFPDISYLSETQKNNFQFLIKYNFQSNQMYCNHVFFSNTYNVIVMITENILAVIIITFKYFSNTFGYSLRKFAQYKKQNGD